MKHILVRFVKQKSDDCIECVKQVDHIDETEIGQMHQLVETDVGHILETEFGSFVETEIEHDEFLFHESITQVTNFCFMDSSQRQQISVSSMHHKCKISVS